MYSTMSKIKRFVSISLIAAFCAVALSACSPNHTQVGGWWVNQQWETASAS